MRFNKIDNFRQGVKVFLELSKALVEILRIDCFLVAKNVVRNAA